MSWTPVKESYDEFQGQQSDPWENRQFLRPFGQSVEIWEKSNKSPSGVWCGHIKDITKITHGLGPYQIRIIFAPLDIWRNAPVCIPIFSALDIPHKFISECSQNVCHSFGSERHESGVNFSWFHFLCKNLSIDRSGNYPEIRNKVPISSLFTQGEAIGNFDGQTVVELPQADYSWLRSGFVLRTEPDGEAVTLVCFGATPYVRRRLEMWITSKSWAAVTEEPYALLDLVMDGLFSEVDTTSWKMADVFRPIETSILQVAKAGFPTLEKHVDFIGLHNCLKHIIYLNEAVASCLLVVDAIKATTASTASIQLPDSLSHRRSLFTSTSLRLSSIQQRVENTIALCFNLVSQQDSMMMRHESMVMRQDASAMKILASITVIFLPTMAVASILGSQLFLSAVVVAEEKDAQEIVEVKTSPLFNILWMFAIPMTLVVMVMAIGWSWYSHVTFPKTSDEMRRRLEENQRVHPTWVMTLNDRFQKAKGGFKRRHAA
ncbi:hypothetical protein TWF192_001845 [Orbilia oligospora]|uniref:Uncharacterized protein n=1 Tax=Orbilia oligospora TaxID=2813651 RepID=A0A6G1MGL3_ORBOL|nr:hypothetical protein TWF679_000565 [Orbilia oligospora]KAF3232048.1 hypothetical protein TWF191_004024 [Orbilia oligospora]KAF3256420.1 hypothetical protein TWF192_001845 [Orbilia oligospora]